jgi:hypothetical protein
MDKRAVAVALAKEYPVTSSTAWLLLDHPRVAWNVDLAKRCLDAGITAGAIDWVVSELGATL